MGLRPKPRARYAVALAPPDDPLFMVKLLTGSTSPRSSAAPGRFFGNLAKPPAVAWVVNLHTQHPGDLFR